MCRVELFLSKITGVLPISYMVLHYPGLVTQCETALEKKAAEADPICRVPIITSHKEEQDLVKKCNRPIVKFMYNRGNNKYSYTK